MITIQVDNKYAFIRGASPHTIKNLEKLTSYLVAGFMYSPTFKSKRWDGKEHLMVFSPRNGYKIPNGLIGDVIRELEDTAKKYKITCNFQINGPKIKYEWNSNVVLRPYQNDAVDAVCKGKKWERGRGLLKMPIRSGKTKTAARIIYHTQRRTLFIVPSQQLLYQTKQSLEESLTRNVGIIGDGLWDVQDVTVATIQTLAKHAGGIKRNGRKKIILKPDEKFIHLSKYFDMVIFDESHHLVADTWHAIIMGFDCRYKIGLSASIHLDNAKECERGVIWLKGCCGDIRHEVETDMLVEQGYLMRQHIELIIQTQPTGYENWGWGGELVNKLIYENEYRNNKIAEKTIEKVNLGMKVLIVSNRINQLVLLNKLLISANVGHAVIVGSDKIASRKNKIKAFINGEINVLLGTIFGEGVDIPEIECVINAEGGQDVKKTIQKMRNMTPLSGKDVATYVDFMDVTNKYFAKHSRERLNTYKNEQSFVINVFRA
jgi:superfamily II DNA or RNA helicase